MYTLRVTLIFFLKFTKDIPIFQLTLKRTIVSYNICLSIGILNHWLQTTFVLLALMRQVGVISLNNYGQF